MIALSRRQALAGAAMLAVPGLALAASDDNRLKAVLDAFPANGDPKAKLAALAGFDPNKLSPSPRFDLLTIRAGLSVDIDLAGHYPGVTSIAAIPPAERAAYYALLLSRRLGNVGVDTARRRLDVALATLTARADAALRAIGYRAGGVGARMTPLMADDRFLYPDSAEGRDRAVADMNRTLVARRALVPAAFDIVPYWCLDVAVSRPAQRDAPAGTRILPERGKPGGYIVDLTDIARRPAWTLGSVVAHELLPGHLLQLPIEAAGGMHPLRADYATGFVEGWAVYAEQLAAAQGAFDGDAPGLVGHLHWLLFRAARARADIGMHVDGWSADRALAFLVEHQGPPVYFAPYAVELRRIVTEPASRAADALAWLAIADRAPADWRRRKAFHGSILIGGRKRIEYLTGRAPS